VVVAALSSRGGARDSLILSPSGLEGGLNSLLLKEDLKDGCGGQLWPAGMALAKYLLSRHATDLSDKTMWVLLHRGISISSRFVLIPRATASPTSPPPAPSSTLLKIGLGRNEKKWKCPGSTGAFPFLLVSS
jgi:hypothetical protein